MLAIFKKLLGQEKIRLLLILLMLVLDTVAQSVLPMIMSALINTSGAQGGVSYKLAALMLGTILFSGVLSVLLCRMSIRTTQACQNRLRKDAYGHMLQLSPVQVKQYSLGELLTRVMSDTGIMADFIMQSIFVLLKPLLLVITGVVLLMNVHTGMLNVVWMIVPVQLVLLVITIRRMLPYFSRIQAHVEKLNSHMKNSLDCIRLVKAYNGEAGQAAGFDAKNGELYEDSISIQMWTVMLNPTIMLLMNLGTMLLLLVCSRLLQQNAVDAGGAMAGFAYIQQIFMSLMMMGEFFPNISRVRISGRRMAQFFAVKPAVADGSNTLPDGPVDISLQDVSFRFTADSPEVLSGASLEIPAGTKLALAGGTGSGKTTVLRLLTRMMEPTGGDILICGEPAENFRVESLYEGIQLVEQNCRLFADTLANNIRCGLNASDEEVLLAAQHAQLEGLISSLPEGMNTFLSESSASLSGGQRQCIAIARALLRKPRVLLMDDCSSSMDLETEFRLMNGLMNLDDGMTLVVVSQRISTLSRFPRIAMLDGGRFTCLGGHDVMVSRCQAYRQLCEAQRAEEGRA